MGKECPLYNQGFPRKFLSCYSLLVYFIVFKNKQSQSIFTDFLQQQTHTDLCIYITVKLKPFFPYLRSLIKNLTAHFSLISIFILPNLSHFVFARHSAVLSNTLICSSFYDYVAFVQECERQERNVEIQRNDG